MQKLIPKKIFNQNKKGFCSQFEKFITKPEIEKDQIQKEKCIQLERQLNDYIKKMARQKKSLLQDELTQLQIERLNFIADYILQMPTSEQTLFQYEIRDAIRNKSPVDPLSLNPTWPEFQRYSEIPFPTSNPNWVKRQEAVASLMPLGLEGWANVFRSVGGTGGGAVGGGKAGQVEAQATQMVEEKKEEVKEKLSFDVELSSVDAAQKIKIIKEIRTILNLGLKEAKDMVEKAPVTLQKDVKKEAAQELMDKLTAIGCVIKLL